MRFSEFREVGSETVRHGHESTSAKETADALAAGAIIPGLSERPSSEDSYVGVSEFRAVPREAGDQRAPEATDVGVGGSDLPAGVPEDLEALASDLADVASQLTALAEKLRSDSRDFAASPSEIEAEAVLAEQIKPRIVRLSHAVTDFVSHGEGQEPGLAVAATAQMTAIESDVRYAKKRYAANRAWARIWDALKRVAPRLWSLISQLVRVREWSVTGQVGTGVLGLAQASISVTFG